MEINVKNSLKRPKVRDLVSRWLINALGILIAARFIDGIFIDGVPNEVFLRVLTASALLGAANSIIRPILILLTLPISILTLGLFTLVINASIFGLVSALVPGFQISDFYSAFLGSLILVLVNLILGIFIGSGIKISIQRGGPHG